MRMKKVISLFVLTCLIFNLGIMKTVAAASMPAPTPIKDFYYEKDEDGLYIIYSYKGTATSIVVPGEIDGVKVKMIYNHAFAFNTKLKSITLQEGMEIIGERAFVGCENLKTVNIPTSVVYIEEDAFKDTAWIKIKREKNPIVIVNKIIIDGKTAEGQIKVGKSVKKIGAGAFKDGKLTGITIPKNVEMIEEYAFSNCYDLKTVSLSEGLTQIGNNAFYYARQLESISIPNSVTKIGDSAFESCSKLLKINIPESLTQFGENVFSSTSWFYNKVIQNPLLIVNNVILYAKKLTGEFIIPEGVIGIAGSAFRDTMITRVVLPKTMKSIDYRAFYYCIYLEEVDMPDTIVKIGKEAFYFCNNLKEITLSKNITYIGASAFGYCQELQKIDIPKKVKCIESWTFSMCSKLNEVNIPDSVTIIKRGAFSYCIALKNIFIPNSVKTMEFSVFTNCSNLVSVTLPNIKVISEWMFFRCSKLNNVIIPDTVTKIESQAFYECTSLKKITIPKSVKTISNDAFTRTPYTKNK